MAPLRAKDRDNLEFATNLPDKEERKKVRRVRVERAIAAQDKDGVDASKNDEETAACSLSQQQVGEIIMCESILLTRQAGSIQWVVSFTTSAVLIIHGVPSLTCDAAGAEVSSRYLA